MACFVDGCERRRRSPNATYCHMHYHRLRRSGNLGPVEPLRSPRKDHPEGCGVDGCSRSYFARGFCQFHYRRWWRLGDPGPAERLKAPRGHSAKGDYLLKLRDGRCVLAHRVVMEAVLDRPLAAGENVHHKNGIRTDNRPENLELWTTSQPKGQRVTDKVTWCVEFLQQYAPELLSNKLVLLVDDEGVV